MKLFLKTKDFSVSGEEFELHLDEELDMLLTKPQPQDLAPYYESEDYISHTDAKSSFTERLYQLVKARNLRNKVQIIDNQLVNGKSILDLGAGTGDFLITAKNFGFEVTGVEPNDKARSLAKDKGLHLWSSLGDVDGQKFKVITLWHVLEHIPNLEEEIRRLTNLLEEDGIMVIAVPNFKSYDALHYKSHWAAYDVPRHLWHFSRNSISKLFARHQMEVVTIKPMWFDSFYVSILSEKYRGNKFYLIKAFFIGLWSNLRAIFTKEHSSLIYILKKHK